MRVRWTEAATVIKALASSGQRYYQANGSYTSNYQDLDINIAKINNIKGFYPVTTHIYAENSGTKSHIELQATAIPNFMVGFFHNGYVYCSSACSNSQGMENCRIITSKAEYDTTLEPGYCYHQF